MASGPYSFIDIAVIEEVRARFAAGDALAILTIELDRVIWANGGGAHLLGFADIEASMGADSGLSFAARRQIAATPGFPRPGRDRPVMVRLASGMTARAVAALVSGVVLPDGAPAVLVAVPAGPSGAREASFVAARAVGGLSREAGYFAAMIAADGSVTASSDGFADLGIAGSTLAELVAEVRDEGDRLVKRLVPAAGRLVPAGIARLTDDPAVHLLIAVDEAFDAPTAEAEPATIAAASGDGEDMAGSAPEAPVEAIAPILPVLAGAQLVSAEQARPAPAVDGDARGEEGAGMPPSTGVPADEHPAETRQPAMAPAAGDEGTEADRADDTVAVAAAPDAADLVPAGLAGGEEAPGGFPASTEPAASEPGEPQGSAAPFAPEPNEVPEAGPGDEPASAETTEPAPAEIAVTEAGEQLPVAADDTSGGQPPAESAAPVSSYDPASHEAEPVSAELAGPAPAEPVSADDVPLAPEPVETATEEAAETDADVEPANDAATAHAPTADDGTARDGPVPTQETPPPPAREAVPAPRRLAALGSGPIRFVWRTDSEGRFSALSEEFVAAVGPKAGAVLGRPFREVAAGFRLDPDGEIASLLERRDTWSGRSVLWPIEGTDLRVPVDLAALPVYSRDRSFEGFRGFGVARLADVVVDPDELGLSLGGAAAVTQPNTAPVEPVAPVAKAAETQPVAEVVRLADHRQADSRLSAGERNAFQEIGARLRRDVGSEPAAPSPGDEADDASKVTPDAEVAAVAATDGGVAASTTALASAGPDTEGPHVSDAELAAPAIAAQDDGHVVDAGEAAPHEARADAPESPAVEVADAAAADAPPETLGVDAREDDETPAAATAQDELSRDEVSSPAAADLHPADDVAPRETAEAFAGPDRPEAVEPAPEPELAAEPPSETVLGDESSSQAVAADEHAAPSSASADTSGTGMTAAVEQEAGRSETDDGLAAEAMLGEQPEDDDSPGIAEAEPAVDDEAPRDVRSDDELGEVTHTSHADTTSPTGEATEAGGEPLAPAGPLVAEAATEEVGDEPARSGAGEEPARPQAAEEIDHIAAAGDEASQDAGVARADGSEDIADAEPTVDDDVAPSAERPAPDERDTAGASVPEAPEEGTGETPAAEEAGRREPEEMAASAPEPASQVEADTEEPASVTATDPAAPAMLPFSSASHEPTSEAGEPPAEPASQGPALEAGEPQDEPAAQAPAETVDAPEAEDERAGMPEPASAAPPAAWEPPAPALPVRPAPPIARNGFIPSAWSLPGGMPEIAEMRLLGPLPLPVLVHAGDRLIHANPAFFALTGYRDLDELDEAGGLGELFAGPAMEGRLKLRRRDGSACEVDAHLQSVSWNGGHALLLALTGTSPAGPDGPEDADPEDPEDPERRVEEMRTIIDTATDGVVLIADDGTVRGISRPAEALFGLDSAEVEGKPFASLFAIESQRAARDYLTGLSEYGVASVLNDGREVIGREAEGRFIPLFMTIGRLPRGGFCAVLRDITQWKRAEEELTQARAQAERASSQKTEFLARVSHEIRTPLNAIIGFSELMIDEKFGPIGSDRYRDYLRDINRSGNHVLDLVNDLLDISKIEAGEQEMNYEAVSLNDALAETVAMMQPQANRERVIIRSSLASRLPNVVADLRSIRQIALNLLSNALRYTQAGGQVIVSTSYEPSGDVTMRVRDTGIGMSLSEIDQALKPFKQINALKRGRSDGTGLGLPLTKAMVEANRARFSITSAPGEGTLVEIVFPSTRVLAE